MKRIYLLLIALTICPISLFAQRLISVEDSVSELYGYKIDGEGDWVIPPKYRFASNFTDTRLAEVWGDDSKHYAINYYGEKVSPDFGNLSYQYLTNIYWARLEDHTYGLYNVLFEPISEGYDGLTGSANEVYIGKRNGMWGIIDCEGTEIVPFQYRLVNDNNYGRGVEDLYYVYYACGAEKWDNDGFNKYESYGSFYTAVNDQGRYGLITPFNEVIVPFKYKDFKSLQKGIKKYYEKTIKPYMLNQHKLDEAKLDSVSRLVAQRNMELASIYPSEIPMAMKMEVKRVSGGYAFFNGDKQLGNTYAYLEPSGKCYVFADGTKFGLVSGTGTELIEAKYDNMELWNAGSGDNIYLVSIDGKYGLVSARGKTLVRADCELISFPYNNTAVALRDDMWWLIGENGEIISSQGYAYIDNTGDEIVAGLAGYETTLSKTTGKAERSIARMIFDEAYDMPLSRAQEKYDKYMLCVAVDDSNKEGFKGSALNNIGSMFEDLGDTDTALSYYQQASDLGNSKARENLKRIRRDRRLDMAMQISQALSDAASNLAASASSYGSIQQYSAGDYSSMISSSSSSSSSSSGSGSSLKMQYEQWERRAKSNYESLTNTGTRTKRNGTDVSGTNGQSLNTGNYTRQKQLLREAQKEMRSIRQKAREQGITIPQSTYETVTVSY